MAPTRCPLCGTAGSACGPHTTVTPVDIPATAITKEPTVADLEHYNTVVNGIPTTLRLTVADAKKRGLTKSAPAERNAQPQAAAAAKAAAPVTTKTAGAK